MLGKGPTVRWQTGRETGKVQNSRLPGGLLALYVLYAAALSVLFFYTALRMAEDCFGPLWGTGKPGMIWMFGLGSLLLLSWNEVLHAMRRPLLRQIGNLIVLLCFLLGCWLLYCRDQAALIRGLGGLAQRYLDAWNRYFLTSLHIGQAGLGTEAQQRQAWVLLLLAAMTLLQVFSAVLQKRILLLFLPAAVLAAEMTVGLAPGWRGMACMFAAGLLSLYLDRHRQFQAVPALALAGFMGVLMPLTAWGLTEPASRVCLSHDRLQAFQHRVEKEIVEYDWQAMIHREGRLDNHSPHYDGKEIMTVTVNELPEENLYLRGYCGADYQESRWKTAEKEFDRACRQHGIGNREAVLLLSGPGGSRQDTENGNRLQYELRYTGVYGNAAYFPYGADLATVQGRYRVRGDYVVEKAKSLESLGFAGCMPGSLFQDSWKALNSDAEKFYLWYNEFVQQHYLAVPEELTEVTDAVNSMEQSVSCQAAQEKLREEDLFMRNGARLLLGALVAGELRDRADYNIEPGVLPRGVDPVEYFLGESRQGYCMHFATAGTLLLRRLGVPARFVSGYVVQPGQFHKSADGYTASVKDEAAHAWVEIWLDRVGWVPVEMTPGYGETGIALAEQMRQMGDSLSEDQELAEQMRQMGDSFPEDQELAETVGRAERAQMPSEAAKQEGIESRTTPSPLLRGIPEEKETEGVNRKENSQKILEGTESTETILFDSRNQQEAPEGWGFAGEGGWAVFGQNGSLRVSHVLWAALGLSAALGLGVFTALRLLRRRKLWQQGVWEDIVQGHRGKAVVTVNRRMYKRLRRKRAGVRTDGEYLAALKRQYPGIAAGDWERYLAVVRKAVYSREEITFEEARLCYAMWKRVQAE